MSVLWFPRTMAKALTEAVDRKAPEKSAAALLPTHHGDSPAGANDAGPGLGCSSLPGASERCPRSGFCGLGAHS